MLLTSQDNLVRQSTIKFNQDNQVNLDSLQIHKFNQDSQGNHLSLANLVNQ